LLIVLLVIPQKVSGMASAYKIGKIYYIQFSWKGKYHVKSLKITKSSRAEFLEKKFENGSS